VIAETPFERGDAAAGPVASVSSMVRTRPERKQAPPPAGGLITTMSPAGAGSRQSSGPRGILGMGYQGFFLLPAGRLMDARVWSA